MNKTSFDKRVTITGNSLIVKVTKELKMLEVKEGDLVRVTLEKIE